MSDQTVPLPEALETIAAVCQSDEAASPMPELASMLRRAAARLRVMETALQEIARSDIGGLQGISEEHSYDADDMTPQQALEREKAWHDEDSGYLLSRILHRQKTARNALAEA